MHTKGNISDAIRLCPLSMNAKQRKWRKGYPIFCLHRYRATKKRKLPRRKQKIRSKLSDSLDLAFTARYQPYFLVAKSYVMAAIKGIGDLESGGWQPASVAEKIANRLLFLRKFISKELFNFGNDALASLTFIASTSSGVNMSLTRRLALGAFGAFVEPFPMRLEDGEAFMGLWLWALPMVKN